MMGMQKLLRTGLKVRLTMRVYLGESGVKTIHAHRAGLPPCGATSSTHVRAGSRVQGWLPHVC